MTATGTDRYSCLECGSTSRFSEPTDQGRIDNPDGPAEYYGDNGAIYAGDREPDPKKG